MPPTSRWSGSEFRDAGRRLLGGVPGLSPTFPIIGLLACVLVPLPTVLVDLLLSLSLAGAVLLLVAGLKVRRTSDFLTFPSLLLLVTLFRLALNVSTTRLILSQADAGQVIDAFAGFVVRGDLIVGGVMFAIITVIQYLVIARGAERVAEVGARFALDGMPGHQAAIDADLRAGVISAREAARRRAELNERSHFHGAMDGAIRFVKGDAMAGLAITSLNLAGGLAVGMGRVGLSWQESLQLYGRLTIGDGLLAQIPALLVSLAAGVLVSRVDREREGEPVRWLQPPMLMVPAVMLGGLALVPGMPALAFATTGIALLAIAVGLAARLPPAKSPFEPRPGLRMFASPADVSDPRRLQLALTGLRGRCTEALGIEAPPFDLVLDEGVAPGRLEVRLDERVLFRGAVGGGDEEGAFEDEALLVGFRAIMDHADVLVDLQDVDAWIERARERRPAIVQSALEVAQPLDVLLILRALLRERLALPPFEAILGVLADGRIFRQSSARPHWAEHARERLASYWALDLLDGVRELGEPHWIRPYRDAEEALLAGCEMGEEGLAPKWSPHQRARWVEAILGEDTPGPRLVICTADARRVVAEVLRGVHPHVPVLSVEELTRAGVALPPRETARWVAEPV
jgi:type III secretion protein V